MPATGLTLDPSTIHSRLAAVLARRSATAGPASGDRRTPSEAAGPAAAANPISRVLTGVMPDLSAAQLVGIIGAVIAVAVSFGVNISKEQQEAVLALAAAVGAILFAADAHVRTHRAHTEAAKHL